VERALTHRDERQQRNAMMSQGSPAELPQLVPYLQKLRAWAVNKKLDMTDAFEEYAGNGYERNMGVMDKNRFRSTMGVLFAGSVTSADLRAICHVYRAGHPDPAEQDGYTQVRWKQFAIDFDNVPLPDAHGMLPQWEPDLLQQVMTLRAFAIQKRLDMTDAFEEYAGSLQERNTGIMLKRRFRSTMGLLFQGNLRLDVLNRICLRYGTGVEDPQEPGTLQQVRWKAFAVDFDEVPPLPPPPLPDPTPEIMEAMRDMNVYCNLNGIDLAWDFEEYLGGKDACSSDVCSRIKFKQALGVLLGRATSLYRHDDEMLEKMCLCYAAGARDARDPRVFESVQWKEFCGDVNRIQSMPYLEGLQGMVHAYPQIGELGEDEPMVSSPITPVAGFRVGGEGPMAPPVGAAPNMMARQTMMRRVGAAANARTAPPPQMSHHTTRASTTRSTARVGGGA